MRIRRVLRMLAAGLVAVVLLLLVAPYFIDADLYKDRVLERIEKKIGRDIEVGDAKVRFLPRLRLRLADVRIGPQTGGKEDLLQAEALSVDLALLPLLSGRAEIRGLALEEPLIHIRRDAQGRFNFTDLTKPPRSKRRDGTSPKKKERATPPDDEGEKPSEKDSRPRVKIANLRINKGKVIFDDALRKRGPKGPLELTDLNLRASDISLLEQIEFAVEARIGPEESGAFEAKGKAGPLRTDAGRSAKIPFDLMIALQDVKAEAIQSYTSGVLPKGIRVGRINGRFEGSGEWSGDFRFAGKGSMADFHYAEENTLVDGDLGFELKGDGAPDGIEGEAKLDLTRTAVALGAAVNKEKGDPFTVSFKIMGDPRSSAGWSVSDPSGTLGSLKWTGKGSVSGPPERRIDITLAAPRFDLTELTAIFPPILLLDPAGGASITELSVSGRLAKIDTWSISGKGTLEEAGFRVPDFPYAFRNVSGRFSIAQDRVEIENGNVRAESLQASFNAKLDGLNLPWSRKPKGSRGVHINARLSAAPFDLSDVAAVLPEIVTAYKPAGRAEIRHLNLTGYLDDPETWRATGEIVLTAASASLPALSRRIDSLSGVIELAQNAIAIRNGKVRIGKIEASLDGTLQGYRGLGRDARPREAPRIEVRLTTNLFDLSEILDLVPQAKTYKPSGSIRLTDLRLSGDPRRPADLSFDGRAELVGVKLKPPQLPSALEGLTAKLSLKPSNAVIEEASFQTGDLLASLSGSLEWTATPRRGEARRKIGRIDLNVKTNTFDARSLAPLAPQIARLEPSGPMALPTLRLTGSVARPETLSATGSIRLDGVSLKLSPKGESLHDVRGLIQISPESLRLTKGQAKFGGQPLYLDLSVSRYGSLFAKGKVETKARLEATLRADRLDLDRFLGRGQAGRKDDPLRRLAREIVPDAQAEVPKPTGPPRSDILSRLDIPRLMLEIGEGRYAGLPFSDLQGSMSYVSDVMDLQQLTFQAAGGKADLLGAVNFQGRHPSYDLQANVAGIDIQTLLASLNKKRKPIEGTLFAQMRLRGSGTDRERLKKNLQGRGRITIRDGRFKGLDIVKGVMRQITTVAIIAGALKGEDYSVYFSDRFEEIDETFTVGGGRMTTESIRMIGENYTLTGRGWIDFDSNLDFRTRVKPSAGFGKSIQKRLPFLAEVPLRIYGKLEKPKTQVDLQGVAAMAQAHYVKRGLERLLGVEEDAPSPPDPSEPLPGSEPSAEPFEEKPPPPDPTQILIEKGLEGLFGGKKE